MRTIKAKSETLRERYHFFKEHAGYVVGERAVCAIRLARAEAFAETHGVEFKWEWDNDCQDPDFQPAKGNEMLGCVCMDADGNVLGSLWGIEVSSPSFIQGVPRDPYLRVIQAELALEARAEFEKRFQAEADALAERATWAGPVSS